MINLGRCLVYLLSHHEKVNLAGWGSFLQEGHAAYFDPEEEAFFPRSYAIRFRPEEEPSPADEIVGFTEQLLIDYIGIQRKVSAQEAERLYREAFDFHQQELTSTGQTTLSGIGRLKVGADGMKLESTMTPMGQRLISARELPILTPAQPLPEEEVLLDPVEPVGVIADEPLEPEINESENKEALNTESTLNHEVAFESNQRRSRAPYGWIAAVGILLLGVAFVVVKPAEVYHFLSARGVDLPILTRLAGNAPVIREGAPVISEGAPVISEGAINRNTLASEDPIEGIEEVDSALAGDSLLAAVEEQADPSELADQARVTYEIIVGSFRSMEQAQVFVEEMAQKNIQVWAIDSRMPENRKKVSCASFPTEGEAYRALKEIQRTIEPGAWVARVER